MKSNPMINSFRFLAILTFVILHAVPGHGQQLIPQPSELAYAEGRFTITPETVIVPHESDDLAGYLNDHIERVCGFRLRTVPHTPETNYISLRRGGHLGNEAYTLSIEPEHIIIRGGDRGGVFYGLQTLFQLMPPEVYGQSVASAPQPLTLDAVSVKDGPRYAYRGAMLDVSRTFFDKQAVMQYLDWMSRHKLNKFHWHLTDDNGWRIEIKKYPELAEIGGQLPNNGRKGGYYTQEEFKDLVNYAKERFITIIPEVDIPGHTAAVFAAYPDFKNAVKFKTKVNIPGQAFNALDVDDPKAMQFTEDVIAELAALAPGNYIHIGGDEAIGLPHDKFVRFINKTREIVLKNGKKMVGWQETARADISEGDVIQHWIYLKQKSENSSKKKDNIPAEYKEIMALFAEFMKEAPKDPGLGISKKAKVILSPSGYVYLDHKYLEPSADSTQNAEQERLGMAAYEKQTIQEMYDWDPMTFNPTVENPQKDVAGIEAAIWCETITNFRDLQFLLMPRLAGVAEKGWSKVENTHWDEYKVRLGAQAPLWEKADWNYFKSSLVDWK